MYQNSKGFLPPKLHEVRVKYGIASDEDIDLVETEKSDENRISNEDVNNTESVEKVEDHLENFEGSQTNDEQVIREEANAEEAPAKEASTEEAIVEQAPGEERTADAVDEENQFGPLEDSPLINDKIELEAEVAVEEFIEDIAPVEDDEQLPVEIVSVEEDNEKISEETLPEINDAHNAVDNVEEELEAQLEGQNAMFSEGKEDPEVHGGNDISVEDEQIVVNVIEDQHNDINEEEIDLSLPEDIQEDVGGETTETGTNIVVNRHPGEQYTAEDEELENEKNDGAVNQVSEKNGQTHRKEDVSENAEMQEEMVQQNDEIRENADANEILIEDESIQEILNIETNELDSSLFDRDLKQEDGDIARVEDLPVDSNSEEINIDDTFEVDIQEDMAKEFAEADIVEKVADETEPVIETNENPDSTENEIEQHEIVNDPTHVNPDDVFPVHKDNGVVESTDEQGKSQFNS